MVEAFNSIGAGNFWRGFLALQRGIAKIATRPAVFACSPVAMSAGFLVLPSSSHMRFDAAIVGSLPLIWTGMGLSGKAGHSYCSGVT